MREKEKESDKQQKAKVRKEECDKNLAKKADFSTPGITCLADEDNLCFDNFENDPKTAAMPVHHNSDTSQWMGADKLVDPDVILSKEEKKKIVDDLCERVRRQRPSSKDIKKVLEKFFRSQGRGWSLA